MTLIICVPNSNIVANRDYFWFFVCAIVVAVLGVATAETRVKTFKVGQPCSKISEASS